VFGYRKGGKLMMREIVGWGWLRKWYRLLLLMNYKLITRLFENVKTVSYLGYYGVWLFSIKNNRFELVVVND
jgi:hypothetical protein